MGMIDLNLLDRRFKVVETRSTGTAILQAFEDSFARYCVIGDRWAPGEHVLLLSRTRFVGDLVDIGASNQRSRERWEQLLANTPALLGTFIAGTVLSCLPSFRWDSPTPADLSPAVQTHINQFLKNYLQTWPRLNELRAEVVDVNALDPAHLHTNAVAIAGSRVVGILDLFATAGADRSRGGLVMPASPSAAASALEVTKAEPAGPAAFIAHPRIRVPGLAARGDLLPFTVGFSDHPDPDAEEQKRIKIDDPEPGETVLVIVTAQGAWIEEPSFAELPLDLAADHQFTAHVSLDAITVSLRASYLYRNKPVGHVVKSVPVDGAQEALDQSSTPSTFQFKPPFVRSLGKDVEIDDVDLILFVEEGETGCVSWKAYLPRTRKVLGPFPTRLDDDEHFAKELASLRGKYGDSGPSAAEELKVTGQQIAECIPATIMNDALLPVLAQPQPPAILIMTDQAFVPWELARFKSERINGNKPAFLGELARIGRWWTGVSLSGPRSSRSIENVSAVAATEYGLNTTVQTLEHAKAEREWLSKHYWAKPIEATLPDIDDWLETAPRPRGHLAHIALHGFSDAVADSQGLILGDGKVLTAKRLAGEYYEGDIPRFEMLFLNACQVGTAGERLSRIGGFPGAILRAGAVAFIGPLWEVQDSIAEAVAEQFYQGVLGRGEEVGETLRQLRSSSSKHDSITPWAYLFYGHPRLRLTQSH